MPTDVAVQPAHIHLVEDDTDMAREIATSLEARGYVVSVSATADDALGVLRDDRTINLVIADRMLPGGMDGLDMVQQLRDEGLPIPILVLSALGSVDDRVRGLNAGGDDYLTKPFAVEELVARIEALRRRPADTRATMLRVGSLEMDLLNRTVRRNGREVPLLPREFKLLEYLMRRPDQVITPAMLLTDVWNYRFIPQTNVVDVHMGKLRHKVDEVGELPMIHRVRGTGFMLRAAD
ncbi:MAG: response regulator transcription factor [Azospirillaceae bacterium]|nr:response regulator transcription factor [Azospirillaceae bacterium]